MSVDALAELDQLEQRLARIRTPRDAKAEAKWADVMAELARALGLSLEQQNRVAEHRLRAQRRGGALIATSGIGKGKKSPTLGDFNLDDHESARWQAIAGIPESIFEGYISQTMAEAEELTTAGLLKLVPKPSKASQNAEGEAEPPGLLRFCQNLETATIMTLILRVCFPEARTALDVTYGRGNFWDGTAHVEVTAHDLDPERAPDGAMDFTALAYDDESFDVVPFDPPHLADAGANSVMGQQYGTYRNGELEQAIRAGVREAWRVSRLGIIVKVTDQVHGQRLVEESEWVRSELDMLPYEKVYQVRSRAMVPEDWEQQLSAYNNGSTYLIFRKGDQRHMRRATA